VFNLLSLISQEAYNTCCKVYGETHPQALVLLNSLGTVSSLMGKEDEVKIVIPKVTLTAFTLDRLFQMKVVLKED
jgi:hypothetical protein